MSTTSDVVTDAEPVTGVTAAPDAGHPDQPDPSDLLWVDGRNGLFPWPWWKVLPLALVVGAIVSLALTFIMLPIYEGQIEDRAADDLRRAGIDPDRLTIDANYRDLTITGTASEGVADPAIEEAAIEAAVEGYAGQRDLDVELRPAPVAQPDPEP